MGVSATGQGMHMSALRNGLATALVVLGLFYYLYGPPLTQSFRDAATDRCNELTGSSTRGYVLKWETTTLSGVDVPHWACYPVGKPATDVIDLGWWVDL